MSEKDLPTAVLLEQVFPGSGIGDAAYLDWLYRRSPFGEVVEVNADDELGRSAHYAVVPCDLTVDGVRRPGALSLNTAVHERARGGGVFTRLAEETYAKARERGVELVVGVANANSTPGFTRRLGFTLLGQLPAQVLVPSGVGRRVGSARIDEQVLASEEFRGTVSAALGPPPDGLARTWTPETLAWRLTAPHATYAWHVDADGAGMVTTAARVGGLPVAMLLKVLAPETLSKRRARALVAAACRFHRAPIAIHVGVQLAFPLTGVALPQRLRPSPLNFIVRDLGGGAVPPRLGAFEFLDFDAY